MSSTQEEQHNRDPHAVDSEHEEHQMNIWGIGACLFVLTAATSATLWLQKTSFWAPTTNALFVFMISVCKASFVVAFFMHFKYERAWKYVLCIPPLVLAVVIVFSLLPDVGFDTYQRAAWNQ